MSFSWVVSSHGVWRCPVGSGQLPAWGWVRRGSRSVGGMPGVSTRVPAAELSRAVLGSHDWRACGVRVVAGAGPRDAAGLHARGDRAAVTAVVVVLAEREGPDGLARAGLLRAVRGRQRAAGGLPASGPGR